MGYSLATIWEINRLKKKIQVTNNNNVFSFQYVDSNLYIARFRSISIPPFVFYMGKRIYLIPYIEKVLRCQRFGHISKLYRTSVKNAICNRCGKLTNDKTHNTEVCKLETPFCINCKRLELTNLDHEASSNSCPAFIRQKKKKNKKYYRLSERSPPGSLYPEQFQLPFWFYL